MSATPQTLFIGGKVFDGRGQVLPNHGVLVEGKNVARVAPAGEFTGFAGRRVDTGGMTLMPGMADCHVHLVYTGSADPHVQMSKQGPAQITPVSYTHLDVYKRQTLREALLKRFNSCSSSSVQSRPSSS